MSDQNRALEEILPDVQRAASTIALEWPEVVQGDDVAQEISLRLLTDDYAETVARMEPGARRRVLHRIAQQIASGERVDYEYFSGNFRYSTGEVRAHLERGALVAVEQEELGNGLVQFSVEHVDIRRAFVELPENHREVLIRRFGLGDYDGYPINVTRAVDALTGELNRQHRRDYTDYEGPGSRRAMSNSAAAAVNRNNESRA